MTHSSQWISDATDATFDQDVIARSHTTPVLVDFWADWCAPCRMLGPALEAAVDAREGQVHLVKVDVEKSQAVAQRYGVQGIPVVKAFIDGQVAHEFVGARDRRGVDAFIDEVVPAAEEQALAAARLHLDQGRPEAVAAAVAPALAAPTLRDPALLLLARSHAALGQPKEAREVLGQLTPGSPEAEEASRMTLHLELMGAANGTDEPTLLARVADAPEDSEAHWALAGRFLAQGKTRDALDELLEILKRDRAFRDDGARVAMLGIFEDIGIHEELSREFRQMMQIYL